MEKTRCLGWFTKEKLLEYKAQGMTDERICKEVLFVSRATFQRVKQEIGAVRVRTPYNSVKKEYAIYKGEEFLFSGNVGECAEYLGIKPQSVRVKVTKTKQGNQKHKCSVFLVERD